MISRWKMKYFETQNVLLQMSFSKMSKAKIQENIWYQYFYPFANLLSQLLIPAI